MSLLRLEVTGLQNSRAEAGIYALLLSEIKGSRKLPIIIGNSEALSINIALNKSINPLRPLTHDLFKNIFECFDIIIKKVIIHKLVDGIFYAIIICDRDSIEEIIDSRPSDAIALALRFGAPIFAYETVLEKAGIEVKNVEKNNEPREKQPSKPRHYQVNNFKTLSKDELHSLLTKAVEDEDYEKAASVRDELLKRESNK